MTELTPALIVLLGLLLFSALALGVGLGFSLRRRRRERSALEEEQARMSSFLDAFPDAAAIVAKQGEVLLANRGFQQLLRVEDAAVTRLDAEALEALSLPGDLLDEIRGALASGERYTSSTQLVGVDEQPVPVELIAIGAPRAGEIGLVIRDRRREIGLEENLELEKRRREEQQQAQTEKILERSRELKKARDEYQDLYDNAPFMYQTVDPYGYLVSCNRTEARALGYEPSELMGRSFLDLIDPEDEKALREHLQEAREHEEGLEHEVRLVHRDGHAIQVLIHSTPVIEEGGTFVGVRSQMMDVTSRRQREELLERATQALAEKNAILAVKNQEILRVNKSRGEFISSVSHELRTPLHAVIGYAELLGRGLYGDLTDRQKKAVDGIVERGNDLLDLINNILDLSRIEAGRLHLELTRFNPVEVLEEVAQTARLLLREAEADEFGEEEDSLALLEARESLEDDMPVQIRTAFHDSPTEVHGDRGRYRQVVLNLVSNAVRYTEEGHIDIICRRERDGSFVTAVSDTGVGISPEDQESIFEPFVQVEASSTRIHGGTGLGLSIARKLTEQLGGRLTLTSRQGVGSTFYLRLPTVGPEPSRDDIPQVSEATLLGMETRQASLVLVVGKEGTGYVGIKEGMRAEGLELLEARTPSEGFEVACARLPTAIVHLLSSRAANPADLVTLIRNDPVTAHIPIVLVGPPAMSASLQELSVDDYVTVPTDGVEVANHIWPLIGQEKRRILLIGPSDEAVDLIARTVRERGFSVARAQRGAQAVDFLGRNWVPLVVACNDMADITVHDLLHAIEAMGSEGHTARVVLVLREPISKEQRSALSGQVMALLDPREMGADEIAARVTDLLQPFFDADAVMSESIDVRAPSS